MLLVGRDPLEPVAKLFGSPADPGKFLESFLAANPGLLSPIYVYPGQKPDIVLVVAGVHPSECSGTEIANWLRVKMDAGRGGTPYYTTVIVPELFTTEGDAARKKALPNTSPETGSNKYREIERFGQHNSPSREFPRPGTPVSEILRKGSLAKGFSALDDGNDPQPFTIRWKEKDVVKTGISRALPEILALTFLVEALRPIRIVSVHGKRLLAPAVQTMRKASTELDRLDKVDKSREADELAKTEAALTSFYQAQQKNAPGIYVDPRYTFSLLAERTAPNRTIDPQKFNTALDPAYPNKKPPKGAAKTTFSSTNRTDGVEDDDLALQLALAVDAMASAIPLRLPAGTVNWRSFTRFLVVGNRLHGKAVKSVHYAQESSEFPGFAGFSLGDWGPVAVASDRGGFGLNGVRGGAPVYTVETFGYQHSGAFDRSGNEFTQLVTEDGKPTGKALPKVFDAVRSAQLQAYAEAILAVALDKYTPSPYRVDSKSKPA
jgi:hypothetical protein